MQHRALTVGKEWRTSLHKISRWIDALWGYDVFIAHRRADAEDYAKALHSKLEADKVAGFIDQVVYLPGESLLVATKRHVAKSTLLLLLGSPKLLEQREGIDWVQQEVETYLETHSTDPRLILVDFGGEIAAAMQAPVAGRAPVLGHLHHFIRVTEPIGALDLPPSEAVLTAIHRNLQGRRRDRSRLRLFQGIAASLAVLATVATVLGIAAANARRAAEARRLVVEAQASFGSPPAAQAAIGQARAALHMGDTPEVRALAGDIVDRMAVPIDVLRSPGADGGVLFAASIEGPAMIWESAKHGLRWAEKAPDGTWQTRTLPATKISCRRPTYSSDGRRTACLHDGVLSVSDTATGAPLRKHPMPGTGVDAKIDLGRAGTHVAVADGERVTVVDIESGTSASQLLPDAGWPALKLRVADDGRSVCLTPSSRRINTKAPAFLVDMVAGTAKRAAEHWATIQALEFDSEGKTVVVGSEDGRIDIVNVASATPVLQFQSLSGLTSLALSADGRFIAVGARGVAVVHAAATGGEVARAGSNGPIYGVAFDTAGTSLLTAGAAADSLTGEVILWNLLRSADFVAAYHRPRDSLTTLGFDAKGRLVLVSLGALHVVDRQGGSVERRPLPADFDINGVEPGVGPHDLLFHGRRVSNSTRSLRDASGERVGPELEAGGLTATPDGQTIAYVRHESDGKTARIGVWRDGQTVEITVPESVRRLELNRNGTRLLVGFDPRKDSHAELVAYDVGELKKLGSVASQMPLVGLEGILSPDGLTAVVAEGRRVAVRRVPGFELVEEFELGGAVQALRFSPSGRMFATVDASGTFAVYQADGKLLTSRRGFFQGSQRNAMAFSPDDAVLAVMTDVRGVGTLRLIALQTEKLAADLCGRQLEEPSVAQWRAILPDDKPPGPCTSGAGTVTVLH